MLHRYEFNLFFHLGSTSCQWLMVNDGFCLPNFFLNRTSHYLKDFDILDQCLFEISPICSHLLKNHITRNWCIQKVCCAKRLCVTPKKRLHFDVILSSIALKAANSFILSQILTHTGQRNNTREHRSQIREKCGPVQGSKAEAKGFFPTYYILHCPATFSG